MAFTPEEERQFEALLDGQPTIKRLNDGFDDLAGKLQAYEERGIDVTEHKETLVELANRITEMERTQGEPNVTVSLKETTRQQRLGYIQQLAGAGVPDGEGTNRAENRDAYNAGVSTIPQRDIDARAMLLGNAGTGGVWATSDIAADTLLTVTEISRLRQYARVRQSSGMHYGYRVRDPFLAGEWAGESSSPSTTSTQVAGDLTTLLTSTGKQLRARITITQEDLIANPELAGMVTQDVATTFAQKEGKAFIDGASPDQPAGLLGSVNPISTLAIAAGGSINTSAEVLAIRNLKAEVKDAYRPNGVWMMNYSTWTDINVIAAGDGHPLIIPGNQQDETALRLWGNPVIIMPDMPDQDDGTGLANAPIIFGDPRFYLVHDVKQMYAVNDPIQNPPNINYSFYRWVNGLTLLPEAFVAGIVAA